jgi:hypothetical protein
MNNKEGIKTLYLLPLKKKEKLMALEVLGFLDILLQE